MNNFDSKNFFDDFVSDLTAANLQSYGSMSIIEFANRIVFNNDPDFQLYPTQKAILKAYYGEPLNPEEKTIINSWVDEDRSTWVEGRKYISLILEAGRRASKMVAIDTKVKTTEGFKKLENIHIGDYVYNEFHEPTKVVNETNIIYNKKCYELLFSNGQKVKCSDDHLWRTIDLNNTVKVLTTKEIVDTLYIKNKPNYCVDLYNPIDNKEKRFIIGAESIASVPVKCLEVEDENHVFLITKSLIPTHNCNSVSSIISTTLGDITYGELHQRLNNNEKIGIYTYDIKSNITKAFITYDIKSELNAIEQTYKITTETGKTEIVNSKHPFLTCNNGSFYPVWKELKDLTVGKCIATSAELSVFGSKYISNKQIRLLSLLLIYCKDNSIYNKHLEFLKQQYNNDQLKIIKQRIKQDRKQIKNIDITSLNKECTIKLLKYLLEYSNKRMINTAGGSLENPRTNTRNSCEFSIHVYNGFEKELSSQLLKLGISSYLIGKTTSVWGTDGLAIANTNSVEKVVELFGWNIYKGKEHIRRTFHNRQAFNSSSDQHGVLENKYPLTTLPSDFKGMPPSHYQLRSVGKKHLLKEYALQTNDSKLYDWTTNSINWEQIISIEPYAIEQTIALEVAGTHVIGNAIISHNSTMASIIALKEFYDLIILDSPQKKYGMIAASPISILILAQSKAQVKETIFTALRGYAENSRFFKSLQNKGEIEILSEEIRCRSKNISIFAKHTNTKSLVGYTIKAMILDEVARFESLGEDGKNKAFEIWDNVGAGGATFGSDFRKVAISSAWQPGDPIEQMYNIALKNPSSLAFKLTTFHINLSLKKGVTEFIKSEYVNDFIKARREFEGIRFTKFNTFIEIENLNKATRSVSAIDSIPCEIDTPTPSGIMHYAGLTIQRITPNQLLDEPSFIHVDPALKKDSAALAIARPVQEEGKWKIQIDALLKWEPHTDHQGNKRIVSFLDIEEKLITISKARKVGKVTFDQWNSIGIIQKLNSLGIDAQQASCSREMQFTYYTLFRDLLAHDYIILPRDNAWTDNAITELSELVLKANRQIIHPTAGKDLADAIVNSVYQCNQHMIRTGLNLEHGLHTNIVQSAGLAPLRKITVSKINANNLKIGSAIDKLYNKKFKA
jgi:hypothetical protein